MAHYQMVPVVAGCVIFQDGKFLLVQEKQQKAYGLWGLPAGHVEEGESFEEAALRETYEETGFHVSVTGKLAIAQVNATRPVLHAYTATIASGELIHNEEEVLDVRWFTLEEIEKLQAEGKLRNAWTFDSIMQVTR